MSISVHDSLDDLPEDALVGPGPTDPEDWMPTVLSVEVKSDHRLTVTLSGGRILLLDLTGLMFGDPVFTPARVPAVFATARPGSGGRSVLWGDDEASPMEVGSDTLLEMAEAQRPLSGADLRAWQERHGLNNREAAMMLGTSLRTWQRYLDADVLPTPVHLAVKAMERPAVFSAVYRPSRETRNRQPGVPVRPGRPPKAP